jgi:hypothetical protein
LNGRNVWEEVILIGGAGLIKLLTEDLYWQAFLHLTMVMFQVIMVVMTYGWLKWEKPIASQEGFF